MSSSSSQVLLRVGKISAGNCESFTICTHNGRWDYAKRSAAAATLALSGRPCSDAPPPPPNLGTQEERRRLSMKMSPQLHIRVHPNGLSLSLSLSLSRSFLLSLFFAPPATITTVSFTNSSVSLCHPFFFFQHKTLSFSKCPKSFSQHFFLFSPTLHGPF
ncbi:unnamed protein product [Arctogadus glacialis]